MEVQQQKRKEYLAKKAKLRLADAAKINSTTGVVCSSYSLHTFNIKFTEIVKSKR